METEATINYFLMYDETLVIDGAFVNCIGPFASSQEALGWHALYADDVGSVIDVIRAPFPVPRTVTTLSP